MPPSRWWFCIDGSTVDEIVGAHQAVGVFSTLGKEKRKKGRIIKTTRTSLLLPRWYFYADGSDADDVITRKRAGLIMVNAISTDQLDNDAYTDGACGSAGSKVWLILGLVMSFASLIVSRSLLNDCKMLMSDTTCGTWFAHARTHARTSLASCVAQHSLDVNLLFFFAYSRFLSR